MPSPDADFKPKTPKERRDALAVTLKGHNYDPLVELITLAKSEQLSAKDRADIARDLLGYLMPKAKSVEVDAKVTGGVSVIVQRLGGQDVVSIDTRPAIAAALTAGVAEGERE